MSILVDDNTRLLVQGITGREGCFHTRLMLSYGTNVVAGVTPGRGGTAVEGVPVFDSVQNAVDETEPNACATFVPARFAADALLEAGCAGVPLIICITEGIPVLDMLTVCAYLEDEGVRLIGPNCPGVISPGKAKVGIMPAQIHRPGPVGVVSRSGTLTYEVVHALTKAGLGQSTSVGIGGDPLIGSDFTSILRLFDADPDTRSVVLIGEIGGDDEERAAQFIGEEMTKPVVAFVAGRVAPPGRRMGHAGAIITGTTGTAQAKIAAFEAAGVPVAEYPGQVATLLREAL